MIERRLDLNIIDCEHLEREKLTKTNIGLKIKYEAKLGLVSTLQLGKTQNIS
jgi:hypothetical protein